MSTDFLSPKELVGAYVINRKSFEMAKIQSVSSDGRMIRVEWAKYSMSYFFPNDFKDKICLADRELQEKLEKGLASTDTEKNPPYVNPTIPSLVSRPRPTVQPSWVEEKEKSDFSLKGNTLKPYHFYGTSALSVYRKGCKALGWKTGHDADFDKHTVLYSKNITPEGYSLWFLTHHRWIEDINNVMIYDYKWWNTIGRDIIHEDWRDRKLSDEERQDLKYDDSTRLTFALGKNGQYFYIGLFKPIGIIWDRIDGPKGWGRYHTKVYQRIS